jgi:hypothetical protein
MAVLKILDAKVEPGSKNDTGVHNLF